MKEFTFSLTPKEILTVNDTSFLARKRLIIEKVMDLFAHLELSLRHDETIKNAHQSTFPSQKPGKISQGENYKGLPYVVLDYPSLLSKDHLFAFRSIFWWGNYFSNHFILKGKYLDDFRNCLLSNLMLIRQSGAYIDLDTSPWNHDVNAPMVRKVKGLTKIHLQQLITDCDFVKLIWTMPIEDGADFVSFSRKRLQWIQSVLKQKT